MRALVTGATGFIGSHLVRRLDALGAEVHAVCRHPPSTSDHGEIWRAADLNNADSMRDIIRSTRPDVVFHLASEVTGERDVRLVQRTLHANLVSVVNLLTAVAEAPATKVVLAGSLEEPKPGPAELPPSSPYAAAKWAATGYARMFHQLWGLRVAVLRVAIVYGPGQRDTTKLLPYATLALLRGEPPRLGSGTRLLDWVYIDDVVEAFIAAAQAEQAAGGVFEIGSGSGLSIHDTMELLAEAADTGLRPEYGAIADRPQDTARIADLSPAAEVLRWRPSTSLHDGLRRTVQWYAEQLQLGRGKIGQPN
jgi:nucleoside-diphosphate-sugar epimerase